MSTLHTQKREHSVIRNFIGILFFIASGLFVYLVGLMAFLELPYATFNKFLMMTGFFIPLTILHLIGLAIYQGVSWKTSTGITFIVGGVLNVFVLISMLSIKGSPELSGVIDATKITAFNDYLSGLIVMAVFTGVGATLYLLGKSVDRSKESAVTSN